MRSVYIPRWLPLLAVAACGVDPPEAAVTSDAQPLSATRDHVAGDVYHYAFTVRVGDTPNAQLVIHRVVRERAPWIARRTPHAILANHGDFAKFTTNFMPGGTGMAAWLAARDIDVWGLDRRWASAPADADISDFDAMSLDQELDDVGVALAFARAMRLSPEQIDLVGFSRGGELGYFYAQREGTQPAWQRHVKGLVPLDVYASVAPDQTDTIAFWCETAAAEYDALAQGFPDAPNQFQIDIGTGDRDDPDATNIYFPRRTNHEAMLLFVGQTYAFFPASPLYHLSAPVIDADGDATALRVTDDAVIDTWLTSAPVHESMREAADTDQLTCANTTRPLSTIHVPVFLLGMAGGYGALALYSTTQVSSTDVTTLIVHQLGSDDVAEDLGHGDLLYAPDAATFAWQPLLDWLRAH
jgi:hypothetical protein